MDQGGMKVCKRTQDQADMKGWNSTQDQAGMKFLYKPNTWTRLECSKANTRPTHCKSSSLCYMFFLYILFQNFTILNHLVRHVGYFFASKMFFQKICSRRKLEEIIIFRIQIPALCRGSGGHSFLTFSRLSLIVFIQKKPWVPPPPCPISAIWFKLILTKLSPIWSFPQPAKWKAGAKSRSFKFKFGGSRIINSFQQV